VSHRTKLIKINTRAFFVFPLVYNEIDGAAPFEMECVDSQLIVFVCCRSGGDAPRPQSGQPDRGGGRTRHRHESGGAAGPLPARGEIPHTHAYL